MDLLQIKGHKNLVRDLETGAILNTDSETAIARKRLREQKKNEREQLEKNTNDINSMKAVSYTHLTLPTILRV